MSGRKADFGRTAGGVCARYHLIEKEREQQRGSEVLRAASAAIDLVATIERLVQEADRDYDRSKELRNRDRSKGDKIWEAHRQPCRGTVNRIPRRAHGWCVDFTAAADELVGAGLALPEWFVGMSVCRRVVVDGREIELYRNEDHDYEMSIPYRKGSINEARKIDNE